MKSDRQTRETTSGDARRAVCAGWLGLLVACIVGLGLASSAAAQTRVALVIGNGAYTGEAQLPNPPNDARHMAEMLRRDLGFEVIGPVLDGPLTAMDAALDKFQQAAQGADIALFFYAGHGMELHGQNLLLPTDARLAQERDALRQTIPLDEVLQAMKGARVKLVLLDACRNNPLADRMLRTNGRRGGNTRGLVRVDDSDDGTLIAFATAPGLTAADGNGVDSPFTTALLAKLPTEGDDIRLVLGDVGAAVRLATNGQQRPWTNFNLSGKVVLRTSPQTSPAPEPATAALPPPPSAAPQHAAEAPPLPNDSTSDPSTRLRPSALAAAPVAHAPPRAPRPRPPPHGSGDPVKESLGVAD